MPMQEKEKEKALENALSQIERQFGKGSIMRLGEAGAKFTIDVIPSGSLALDIALGVGGMPRGRVIEIYGPESSGKTTCALHVAAEAQRAGGIAAYIDAEHALDPSYAARLGVDIDNLLISQPDTGEQALEIAEALVRSGAVDVVVIDSVAALVPKAEIEGEMGDSHVGLQARLMSQALRKLAGAISHTRTCVIFINQLREKVGVMFGCLTYTSRVTLADGRQVKIGQLVNQQMPVEVLSLDRKTGRFIPRRVVSWFRNGAAERFLMVRVHRRGGNGRAQVGCTPNHPILTPGGWVRAEQLKAGDTVVLSATHRLSDFQWQVVRGSVMGDGALSPLRQSGARLRIGHGPKQDAYAGWKASLFANVPHTISQHIKGGVMFETSPLEELLPMRTEVYRDGCKCLSEDFIQALTPLSLAVWYMDDGTLALRRRDGTAGRSDVVVQRMHPDSRNALLALLQTHVGDDGVKLIERGRRRQAAMVFTKDGTDRFHALIAPYVHPSMEYKLLPQYRGRFAVTPTFVDPVRLPIPAEVVSVTEKPRSRSMQRFDIEVEGSHNFLADGVVVHNSPEVTPGGRALKFYASIRLDVRRIETLKQGQETTGIRVRAKVVKNKVAPPFRQAEFDLLYGTGISKEGDLIDIGTEMNILTRSGTWYSYGDQRIGQGRENAREFLKTHPDSAASLEQKIRDALSGGKVKAAAAAADDDEEE
ncbi:MAG TPA: recombinase RecA [Bacillota bacterium]|nr:recombinase RecA [Bacillota bacterium]